MKRDDMTPEELKQGEKLRQMHRKFKMNSISPKTLTDVLPATAQPMPENLSEISVFNGYVTMLRLAIARC